MSLMQCKNSKIQNAINNIFLSCCIPTWIECLIFSFVYVFVVVGMYNLILLTSSICLVDRYQETPVFRVHTPQPKQNSRLFPGFFQALKTFFQAVRVKYAREKSHRSD